MMDLRALLMIIVMLQIVASLRIVIYKHKMFIVQAIAVLNVTYKKGFITNVPAWQHLEFVEAIYFERK
jgi:hypothetical protein